MSKSKENHPYLDLGKESFWKSAVGDLNPLSLSGIYKKKFNIEKRDRMVTAGSCFAQHIARKLKASGFNFCDYEAAPSVFPKHLHEKYNYGFYSARYCNIYTVRQLLQTFERAFGERVPLESEWSAEKGYYDPFRPLVEPNAFSTKEDLIASRESHLRSVRNVFLKSDLFIFTLGLTEGWVSKVDGSVFPLCPGTVAGEFDSTKYEFKNFSFQEIFDDLKLFVQKLRAVNPSVKILFTVSPVPLTATKSGEHIMVATMYSKSVLRAIAGQFATEFDFIDYFPSYEIIAAPSMRGMFFEPNMRSVNHHGVDFVMSHFFKEHKPIFDEKVDKKRIELNEGHDVVCEEMLLEQGLL